MPAVDDDAAVVEAPESAPEAQETEPARAPQAKAAADEDDVRSRIVKRARELRDADAAKGDEEPPAAAEAAEETPETGDIDPAKPPQNEKTELSDEFVLRINGKDEKLSREEVIRLAQIAKASDNVLDEAKGLKKELRQELDEVRKLREGLTRSEHPPTDGSRKATQPDQSQGQPDPEHPPAEGLAPEKLRNIVERIQVGDADEGAQALTEFFNEVESRTKASKSPATEDVDRRVDARIAHRDTQAAIDKAMAGFATKFEAIVKDDDLATVGKQVLMRELRKDLVSAGVDEEDLAKLRSDEAIIAAHRDFHAKRKSGIRSYDDIFDATGAYVSEKFVKDAEPKPTQQPKTTQPPRMTVDPAQAQERLDRKRGAAQQPRAVGMRAQVASPQRPKTAADIIRETARQRGYNR